MAKAAVKKSKSQSLPTMEDMGVPEIQQAAASLLDLRTRRISLTKEESEAEASVVAAMEKSGREFYAHDGLEVTVQKGKTKAKVKFSESATE